MKKHFNKVNDKYYQWSQKETKYICHRVYDEINDLLPPMLTGECLSNKDFNDCKKSAKYRKYVSELCNYFRYESELFSDMLDHMKKQDSNSFNELMISKCMNVKKLNKCFKNFNVKMKKCYKISNRKWDKEVVPLSKEIV